MNPIGIVFRRIIYAIPLKLLLILVAVFGVLFACFSNAEFTCMPMYSSHTPLNQNTQITANAGWDTVVGSNVFCIVPGIGSAQYSLGCDGTYITLQQYEGRCFTKDELGSENICVKGLTNGGIFGFVYFSNDCLTQPYSSLQCQTEYNLIPISSVDQNYCTTNNLCPAGGTPSDCPNVGVSNLYINDIFHPGAFNVIMNIPEEIDWDYAYTNSGSNINIDVVGYNQDFEAIEGWIETNNYKPTSEDFTNIFTNFSNFGGLLIATLFVILVFYFVKKMFK